LLGWNVELYDYSDSEHKDLWLLITANFGNDDDLQVVAEMAAYLLGELATRLP